MDRHPLPYSRNATLRPMTEQELARPNLPEGALFVYEVGGAQLWVTEQEAADWMRWVASGHEPDRLGAPSGAASPSDAIRGRVVTPESVAHVLPKRSRGDRDE